MDVPGPPFQSWALSDIEAYEAKTIELYATLEEKSQPNKALAQIVRRLLTDMPQAIREY